MPGRADRRLPVEDLHRRSRDGAAGEGDRTASRHADVKSKAGPNAYSMRGVVKVLVEKAPLYGYHLGRKGPEPLNNQPWFGADRVDRFENVRVTRCPITARWCAS